jgi:ribosome recycling factor
LRLVHLLKKEEDILISIIKKIDVNVLKYGTSIPLDQLALITGINKGKEILIAPWDPVTIADIEKTLTDAGISYVSDSKAIIITLDDQHSIFNQMGEAMTRPERCGGLDYEDE